MPFLTVVTRCYRRPRMLRNNITSLARQSCPDYEQVFVEDDEGRGVGWANAQLQHAAPIRGDYVLILDDDDSLTDVFALATLKQAAADGPDLVVFRADHGPLGVLPDERVWEKAPVQGRIGSCDFIARAGLWRRCIHAFDAPECGDYHFLAELWRQNPSVVWLDRVLAGVQRISRGRPE